MGEVTAKSRPKISFAKSEDIRIPGSRISGSWTCARCGSEITELSFIPDDGRPVFCHSCMTYMRRETTGMNARIRAAGSGSPPCEVCGGDIKNLKLFWYARCSACGRQQRIPFHPDKKPEFNCIDCKNPLVWLEPNLLENPLGHEGSCRPLIQGFIPRASFPERATAHAVTMVLTNFAQRTTPYAEVLPFIAGSKSSLEAAARATVQWLKDHADEAEHIKTHKLPRHAQKALQEIEMLLGA